MYGYDQQPFVSPFYQSAAYQPQQRKIPRFNGRASAESIKLGPNEELLGLDTNDAILWLCTSDSSGRVAVTAFDISQHVEKPPVDVNALAVEVNDIKAMLVRLEAKLSESGITGPGK